MGPSAASVWFNTCWRNPYYGLRPVDSTGMRPTVFCQRFSKNGGVEIGKEARGQKSEDIYSSGP
jgi:hypothetical protein